MQSPGPHRHPPTLPPLQSVLIPDLWQQEAVAALRAGRDVVVQAPTGSGKTLIFELWSREGRHRGQAIYTVPTRALANDKLAEWRARGWNVGIATGDLAENLDAPVLVATLETQKNRLIHGDGPTLLVVDEYQMMADPDRGLNYELAMALAPDRTQLLLLSGSVANPQHVVQWLDRLGRSALLVRHAERPVPLEEVFVSGLSWHLPAEIKGHWPRICARALAEGLGPVLLFAPRRQHAEEIAAELARQLPCPNPLSLSEAQRRVVGDSLARLLKSRIAFHHSGLGYAARAGVIEPLAKAGQLRVVVATMGLAAGINFNLRSVAVTAASYRRDGMEVPLQGDAILQMYGRAGRRGLDESGYVLVTGNDLRLRDGYPCHLTRNGMVDWSALLSLMSAAADAGRDPFAEAIRVQERLFTTKRIVLGVEESLKHPTAPCGLKTDAERARLIRRRRRELRNSAGEWEIYPPATECDLSAIRTYQPPSTSTESPTADPAPPESGNAGPEAVSPKPDLRPLLTEPAALEKIGTGGLAYVGGSPGAREYGRSMILAERLPGNRLQLSKWVRRLVDWNGRQVDAQVWNAELVPQLKTRMQSERMPVVRIDDHGHQVVALVSLERQRMKVPVDRHGVPLWHPDEREVLAPECARCNLAPVCRELPPGTGTALLWRRLLLVDAAGVPTRRGRMVSFFSGGDGLAIAAALEDEAYDLDELVYDLANLDAGFRFCGEDNRWGGRLAGACQRAYGHVLITGYLENGVPPKYGAGAETVVRSVHRDPGSKFRFVTPFLGDGDIDRIIIEWRSLLRQVAHAPGLEWPRWSALQAVARALLHETSSPTITDLPPLEYEQSRRVDHRLSLRRH